MSFPFTPPKKEPELCWQCHKQLKQDGAPFFCNKSCAALWAVAQAFTLNIVKQAAKKAAGGNK
jgi:hypothetical protein